VILAASPERALLPEVGEATVVNPEDVAKFLRDALAGGALGVPELEVMARAGGLLRQNQSITHSKLFKRAKKALGIRSVRDGFGAGRWLWQLPRMPRSTINLSGEPIGDTYADEVSVEDDPEEAPAGRRIPSEWISGVASLQQRWSRKSEQGDKWSFCLTAGTLCPANQERP
jgi:hypothetical protein